MIRAYDDASMLWEGRTLVMFGLGSSISPRIIRERQRHRQAMRPVPHGGVRHWRRMVGLR